jgi:ferredoxin
MKVRIDLDLCQGHGVCAEEAPEVFAVDAAEARVVLLEASPPETLRAKVEAAVKYCPTHALRITEE